MIEARKVAWRCAGGLGIALAGFVGVAYAADGALPKGGVSKGGTLPKGEVQALDQSTGAATKPVSGRRNCFLDFMSVPGGAGSFSADGQVLYFLANYDAKEAKDAKGKSRLALYKVSPKTRKAELMLALDQRSGASLVTYGQPPDAISAVAFGGGGGGCNEGPAALVSISFMRKSEKAVQTVGTYVLLDGPNGLHLADLKKSQVIAMDPATFQTKTARKFPSDERPLYFDESARRLVAWHDDGKQRGLVDYDGDEATNVKRIAFKVGDKLVQSGPGFAVARLDAGANTIDVKELDGWSGLDKPGTYKIALPPAYPVTGAALDVSFKTRTAIVFGSNLLAKQRWQKLFIIDYGKGQTLATITFSAKRYVEYAALDPTGSYAVLEWRDATTHRTTGLRIFDLGKKSSAEIELPAPK